MARKPERLSFGVEQKPPAAAILILALQHAGLALMFVIYPLVAAQALGFSAAETGMLVRTTILAMAVATLLQILRPPLGSGHLAIPIPSPILLPAIIQAGSLGGIGLIAGLTMALGVVESGLARILRRLRRFFPPEVCGVAVFILGVSITTPALTRFSGSLAQAGHDHPVPDGEHLLVAASTLTVMVVLAIFGRGPTKLFALAAGLLVGVLLSLPLGLLDSAATAHLGTQPFIGLPEIALPAWRIELALLPLFALMAVINSVDNLGVLVGVQRLNDADWKRVDMGSASGGILANGAGNVVAGALGGSPIGISSAHVGLAFATGVTSRILGFAIAALLLLAVFSPKVVAALALIPSPVIGAVMIYTAAFLMTAGMDLILSRMLSERRIFTVGLSIVLGLSVALLPGLYAHMPAWAATLFHSELAVAALAAILLNLLFTIGIAQQASVPVTGATPDFELARDFLERQGDLWGARRDVVQRATHAAAETLETLREQGLAEGEMELGARFDEFNLDLFVVYSGRALRTPEKRPDIEAILHDEAAFADLASFMISRLPDRLSQREENGRHRLTLHFEH